MNHLQFITNALARPELAIVGPQLDHFIAPAGGAQLKAATGSVAGGQFGVMPLQGVAIGVRAWRVWGQN